MLRFKSFLNERRDAQHPYTDDQINKGLGSALKNYDDKQANSPQGVRKSLEDLVPKLPDNAAVIKARAIQNPETSNPDSEKNLNIPKVQAPEMPKPFSHPSHEQMQRSFQKFDQFMKTGKAPSPNLHANPKTGAPIGIPDAGGHQATVHVHNPATGQMDSTPSPVPHQVSVHIKNPVTGSSLEVSPQSQEAPQQPSSPPVVAPSSAPQTSPQSSRKPEETYGDMISKSFKNLGISVPQFGGRSHDPNWRDQPGRRQGSSPQASPPPQQAPQASPPPQQVTPQGPSDRTERPGEAPALKFSKKAQDAYREAETFKNDPEAALKKMLGSKYVAPESGQPQHNPQQSQPQPIQSPAPNEADPRSWVQKYNDVVQSSKELAKDRDNWLRQRGVPK